MSSPAVTNAVAKGNESAAKPDGAEVIFRKRSGESEERALARAVTSPTIRSAFIEMEFNKGFQSKTTLLIEDMVDELATHCELIAHNDLSRLERMLMSQANALDAIFTNMAIQAAANNGAGHIGATETYLRLALKCQAQCRSTLEALAEIKTPRSVGFFRQANIGENVQVNNGSATPPRARVKNRISAKRTIGDAE